MSLLKCPICGEQFSDSYKKCPFCAEEAMLSKGKKISKRNRHVSDGRTKSPSIVGPALLIVVLLLAAVMVYIFFGDTIMSYFKKDEPVDPNPVVDDVDNTEDNNTTDETDPPEDTIPEPNQDETTDPNEITLSEIAIDLTVGETKTLTASTNVTWATSNSKVCIVDEVSGEVKGVGAGSAVVTASGENNNFAVCNVTVIETAAPPVTQDPVPSNLTLSTTFGALKPNSEGVYDITLGLKESYNLIVNGTESTITWITSNANVITIDAEGKLNPISLGQATITATVDGAVISCIVRVRNS